MIIYSVILLFLINFYDCKKDLLTEVAKCTSCISMLSTFKAKTLQEVKNKDLDGFIKNVKQICKKFTHGSPKEKFCYSIGGRDDSSATLLSHIFTGIDYLPHEKQCLDLNAKYGEVCQDKVKLKIDWEKVHKYSTKELKAMLKQENDACEGCFEKSEFVKKLLTHKPNTEL
ncbi:hypothetical protein MXB_4862 [Myxobolus squamalis]|nr:hypothetical protein MXB_4862 [Myxobolus squamalis]